MAPNDPKQDPNKNKPAGGASGAPTPPPEEPKPTGSGDGKAPGEITALMAQKLIAFLGSKPSNAEIEEFFTNVLGPMALADGNVKAMIEVWKQFLILQPEATKEFLKGIKESGQKQVDKRNEELLKVLTDWRAAWLKEYTGIISKGINGKIGIRETKIEMAKMGVMFGSLLQGIGILFDKPEFVAMGKGFVDRNFAEADSIGDEIMSLKNLANAIDKGAPDAWVKQMEAVNTDFSPEYAAMIINMAKITDPTKIPSWMLKKAQESMDKIRDQQGLPPIPRPTGVLPSAQSATAGSAPTADITDPNQKRFTTWMAMLKAESGFDYVTYKKNGYTEAELTEFRLMRSPKNAMGIGQMILETAEKSANALGIGYDTKRYTQDTGYQLSLSYKEFTRLWDKFGGNVSMVLGGYNAGEGAVLDFADGTNRSKRPNGLPTNPRGTRIGNPMKNDISDEDFGKRFPYPETRKYIERIKKTMPDFHARAGKAGLFAAADGTPTPGAVAVLNNPEASATATAVYTALLDRVGRKKDEGVKQPYDAVAHMAQAPKTSSGDIKGLRQTAAALSLDGAQPGSFAEGAGKTVAAVKIDPKSLLHLTLERV